MDPRPLTIVVVDDHALFRRGVRSLVATHPTLEIVGEAATAADAVRLVTDLALDVAPDVVLLDLHMPGTSGLAVIPVILAAAPATNVCVLTMSDDDASVLAAIRAGARGYVLKDAEADDFVAAVTAVARGATVFSAAIGARLAGYADPRGRAALPFPDLTDAERAVLSLMARGLANPVIAAELRLSPKTVRNYVTTIFRKLRVSDRPAAIVAAREAGLGGA